MRRLSHPPRSAESIQKYFPKYLLSGPGPPVRDVTGAPDALVTIDGVATGKGPRVTAPMNAGRHDVRAGDRRRTVEVRVMRATIVDVTTDR